jgi:hypothetical protein
MYDDPAAPYHFQCADLVIAEGAAPTPALSPSMLEKARRAHPDRQCG